MRVTLQERTKVDELEIEAQPSVASDDYRIDTDRHNQAILLNAFGSSIDGGHGESTACSQSPGSSLTTTVVFW